MSGRITYARQAGYQRVNQVTAGRDLEVVEEIISPQEVLRGLLVQMGPDIGVDTVDGNMPAWAMALVPENRTYATAHYDRMAREFGVMSWEMTTLARTSDRRHGWRGSDAGLLHH